MPSERLIERGRLAYQALECREEAARYRAAAAELMEAIALAQSGDDGKLKVFLESMDHQAWSSGSPIPAPSTAPSAAPTPAPAVAQSTPSDFVPLVQVAKVELSQDNDTSDSWNEMIQGAQQRAEKENSARKSTAPKPTSKPAPKPAPKPMTKPAVDKLSSAMKKPSTIKSKKLNPTRFGLDVWISLGVHGVLLVILGL
jgi:pyruvate/2-oxoglutarate dehydrogenase complex dihydrolipoamide acyltransferase (E2) component